MSTRMKFVGIGVISVIAIAVAVYWWLQPPELVRCYSRIAGPMTLKQVREAMGRDEDPPDERKTTTGDFERSWSFPDGGRITVVFDAGGHWFYKEIGPSDCGVTPLMGKYIEE